MSLEVGVILQACFISLLLGMLIRITHIIFMPSVRGIIQGVWILTFALASPVFDPIGRWSGLSDYSATLFGATMMVLLGFTALMIGQALVIWLKLKLKPLVK